MDIFMTGGYVMLLNGAHSENPEVKNIGKERFLFKNKCPLLHSHAQLVDHNEQQIEDKVESIQQIGVGHSCDILCDSPQRWKLQLPRDIELCVQVLMMGD